MPRPYKSRLRWCRVAGAAPGLFVRPPSGETPLFKPEAGKTYDQPLVFGPSIAPDVTTWGHVLLATVSYVTDSEAAQRYLPYHFRLADEPVVNIVRVAYDDVDYLNGPYQEFGVGISVVHEGTSAHTAGTYYLAMWLDRVEPITVGRELMGYAKIGGQLPPPVRTDSALSFEVLDQGERLVAAEFRGLAPLDEARLTRIRARFDPAVVLGWKYIPAPGGGVDVDYPTRIPLYFDFDRAWTGQGSVIFDQPSNAMPPLSRRVLTGLHALPVREWRRGLVAEGRGTLPRHEVRRLEGGSPVVSL